MQGLGTLPMWVLLVTDPVTHESHNRSFDACYTPRREKGPCTQHYEIQFTEGAADNNATKLDLCAIRESRPNFNSDRKDKMIEVCYFPQADTSDQVNCSKIGFWWYVC